MTASVLKQDPNRQKVKKQQQNTKKRKTKQNKKTFFYFDTDKQSANFRVIPFVKLQNDT